MALVGCVSISTLQQDLKSSDAQKVNKAKANLSKIITNGKINFSTFSTEDRLWCAKQISDTEAIVGIIGEMSRRRRLSSPQSIQQEEIEAQDGMANDCNAQIIEELLGKVKNNNNIVAILTRGDLQCDDGTYFAKSRGMRMDRSSTEPPSRIYATIKKYMESYVNSIDDKNILYKLRSDMGNWRSISSTSANCSASLHKALHEKIIPNRIAELISGIDDVKKFLELNCDTHYRKVAVAKLTNQNDLFELIKDCNRSDIEIIIAKITDPTLLSELALNETEATWQWPKSSVGAQALEKITDKPNLVKIALLAKNEVIRSQAKEKVGDKSAIIVGIAELLKEDKISEEVVIEHVKALSDNEATISLYNAAKNRQLKQSIFEKLSSADRKAVREVNIASCKKLIEAAKGKSKESFELGGFYLGMNIEDVDMLIGYYFPEWSISETVDSDKKDIRVVYVPQQSRPFCRANKDGKVWQLNFGKSILKKFFNYDVQNEAEWARAYSKQHNINLKYVYLQKDTTVNIPQADLSIQQYNAHLYQETWQWKNNAKGYRVTYFAEPKIVSMYNNIIEQQALYQFRFISSDAGTLRVSIDNN